MRDKEAAWELIKQYLYRRYSYTRFSCDAADGLIHILQRRTSMVLSLGYCCLFHYLVSCWFFYRFFFWVKMSWLGSFIAMHVGKISRCFKFKFSIFFRMKYSWVYIRDWKHARTCVRLPHCWEPASKVYFHETWSLFGLYKA